MRFSKVCWTVMWMILSMKGGEKAVVSGMPVVLLGGSEGCGLTLTRLTAEANVSHVVFRVVYDDETPFIANSSDCELVFSSKLKQRIAPRNGRGIFQRSHLHLTGEKLGSVTISMAKELEPWFTMQSDSMIWISCFNRKLTCLGFRSDGYGDGSQVSPGRRKLLGVEHLATDQDLMNGMPFKPVLLAMTGFVILVVAVGLCANCSNDSDSVAGGPHLVSVETRRGEQENQPVVIESNEQEEGVSAEPAASSTKDELPARAQSVRAADQPEENHVDGAQPEVDDQARHEFEHTEHEEHKGKFWKRSRSSKGSTSSTVSNNRTSDAVPREEGHKDKRSRKESKEAKGRRRAQSDENRDQSDHIARPREATPSLERHAIGLPPPPDVPGEHPRPALPARPIPQRQLSAPDGLAEDNYEEVEIRRTRSVEDIDNSYVLTDGVYDAVRDEGINPRPSSASYEAIGEGGTRSRPVSDIYEVVDESNVPVDDLYSTVADAEKENRGRGRVPRVSSGTDLYQEVDGDGTVEDPYSKVKKQNDNSEALELYEEVDKRTDKERVGDDYEVVKTKAESRALTVEETNSSRVRAQSTGVERKRPEDEESKRPNTIHVMQSGTEGEATKTPFDYLYAKVDRSKKKKNLGETDSGGVQAQSDEDEEDSEPETPPPLPPPYISSQQIKIEMGWNKDSSEVVAENLYDEVNPSLALKPRKPASQVSTRNEDYAEVSDRGLSRGVDNNHFESAQYASAESSVVLKDANGDVKHDSDSAQYEVVTPRVKTHSKEEAKNRQSNRLSDIAWV